MIRLVRRLGPIALAAALVAVLMSSTPASAGAASMKFNDLTLVSMPCVKLHPVSQTNSGLTFNVYRPDGALYMQTYDSIAPESSFIGFCAQGAKLGTYTVKMADDPYETVVDTFVVRLGTRADFGLKALTKTTSTMTVYSLRLLISNMPAVYGGYSSNVTVQKLTGTKWVNYRTVKTTTKGKVALTVARGATYRVVIVATSTMGGAISVIRKA